jgi:hypothetical protein
VENYFPAIIDRADWERVKVRRAAWSAHHNSNIPRTGRANLLAGLSRCPFCDRLMVLMYGGRPNWRYYMCRRAFSGTGCSDRWVRYPEIETALTTDIREVIKSCPQPALTDEARSHQLAFIRRRLRTLRERQASMISEHDQLRQSSRPVVAARVGVENEIDNLLAVRKRLRIDRPKWLDVTLSKRIEKLLTVATAEPLDRKELHGMLRLLLIKVVIDWEHDRLIFHWQHGGESVVPVNMQPQRWVANPRRADRWRFQPGQVAPSLPQVAR